MTKKIGIIVFVVLLVLAIIGLFVWLVVDINLPPRFEIKEDKLIVHDTYKAQIDLKNAEITMSKDKLELTKRVVGTATGSILKGRYTMKGVDSEIYLSIMKKEEEYIFIKNGEERYYINMKTGKETIELYNKLITAQKK